VDIGSMRRDWKLIRQILLTLENNEDMADIKDPDTFQHVLMLNEEQYINLRGELTWKGYDLLEHLTDTTILDDLNDLGLPATEEMFRMYYELKLEQGLLEEEEELVD
jgi:hypothetical protein